MNPSVDDRLLAFAILLIATGILLTIRRPDDLELKFYALITCSISLYHLWRAARAVIW